MMYIMLYYSHDEVTKCNTAKFCYMVACCLLTGMLQMHQLCRAIMDLHNAAFGVYNCRSLQLLQRVSTIAERGLSLDLLMKFFCIPTTWNWISKISLVETKMFKNMGLHWLKMGYIERYIVLFWYGKWENGKICLLGNRVTYKGFCNNPWLLKSP